MVAIAVPQGNKTNSWIKVAISTTYEQEVLHKKGRGGTIQEIE